MNKLIAKYDRIQHDYTESLRRAYSDTKYVAAVMFCLGVVVGIFIVRLAQ